jgi:hypothetical protein
MNDIFDNFQQRPLDTLKFKIQIPIQGVFIPYYFSESCDMPVNTNKNKQNEFVFFVRS